MLRPSSHTAQRFRARYLDVLASVYLYNEHRGYTALDRVIAAVRQRCPNDHGFLAEIEQHRADEFKHYTMFKRWFQRQGRMPLALDTSAGHIDRFIFKVFGCPIDELDTGAVVGSGDAFEKLCRVIMLTEQRGFRQVEILLKNRHVLSDPVLRRIFTIIHRDEPDHFLPYQNWLAREARVTARWQEKWIDFQIHCRLLFAKIPAIFLDSRLPRMAQWPDAMDAVQP
ncbi:MAG: hypothetical protein RLZZ136_1169 [Pseudomonadota bacterium]|jgi:hypothetical protein